MKALEHQLGKPRADAAAWADNPTPARRPDYLYLVTAQEVEELRLCLHRGQVPPDLEAKLGRLAEGDLTARFVARNSRLFLALLQAVDRGLFADASPPQCERLLRVLAYVRKDDDAIADYQPGGFKDDQGEVRAALLEFPTLLKSFKAWHLSRQVPSLWRHPQPPCSAAQR
jgi:hypothetical protein